MNDKYKLLENDTIEFLGRTFYRIEALKDFSNVKKGDKGGYIEKEQNLSFDNNAWVYDDAKVYDNAQVYGNAQVYDNAFIYSNAEVCGIAEVCGNAEVYGSAEVYEGKLNDSSLIVIQNIGSECGILTAYKSQDEVIVTKGSFTGNLQKFADKVEEVHGENQYGKEYQLVIELIKMRLGVEI